MRFGGFDASFRGDRSDAAFTTRSASNDRARHASASREMPRTQQKQPTTSLVATAAAGLPIGGGVLFVVVLLVVLLIPAVRGAPF